MYTVYGALKVYTFTCNMLSTLGARNPYSGVPSVFAITLLTCRYLHAICVIRRVEQEGC